MKIVGVGKRFEIYEDDLKTYDTLPANIYTVRFNKMTGFYLEQHSDFEIKEEKVYGVHTEKVEKVLKSFGKFNRNLGVILSGHKGIGKSLFAKMLGIEAVKKELPVVIVDSYIPGIAAYIESIEQEIMVLFDEFDKTFCSKKTDDANDPQASMLSLFDGTSQGKKLYVITCNNINKLNDYLINRPGRFHYHMRFDFPTSAEVTEYLTDNLDKQYHDEIQNVVNFARKVNLNYDCLRAVAFELNEGGKFKDIIKDLNIINMNPETYDISLHFATGLVLKTHGCNIDFFDSTQHYSFWMTGSAYDWVCQIGFTVKDCVFDEVNDMFIVKNGDFEINYDDSEYEAKAKELREANPTFISIQKRKDKKYHYTV